MHVAMILFNNNHVIKYSSYIYTLYDTTEIVTLVECLMNMNKGFKKSITIL